MTTNPAQTQSDIWSDWLLHRRHGDSAQQADNLRPAIDSYAARVLEGAKLQTGMTLVDVGTGEGLIALLAIARIGPSLKVIMTDISLPMLHYTEQLIAQRGIGNECSFIHASAEDLSAIPDNSVDVVTTRSVLAYVADKRLAFREMFRVLKPGGRISLAEPVFRDDAIKILAMKNWIDQHPDHEQTRYMQLVHQWKSAQYPDTLEKIAADPMTNYSERDLFIMATESRFAEIHVELHIDSTLRAAPQWDQYIECSPHPLAPPLSIILQQHFTPEDRHFFEQTMRPLLEKGELEGIERMVYLTATKPVSA